MNLNILSVQVELIVKVELYQLCIQESEEIRHSPCLLNPPFLPMATFS